MKRNTVLLLTIILFFFSCKLFEPDIEEFTLKRENYIGNELRIDGYYYDGWSVELFYRNGVNLYGYSGYENENDLKEVENKFVSGEFYNDCKNSETNWGIFIIKNDTIKYERYNPSVGPGYLHSLIWEGPILNDTTFHIIRYYRYEDGKKIITETDKLYRFKKFSPKPDSTNNFIE